MKIKTVGIIGLGNFGTLLASILKNKYEVFVYHYKNSDENRRKAGIIGIELADLDQVARCDLVILAVPISRTEETIEKIAPLMKEGAILMDTCSVKEYPCDWLNKYAPQSIQIIGTHPMFGPTTSKFKLEKQEWTLDGLQIVLCPLRIDDACLDELKGLFLDLKLKIIETTPKEHDRQNAKTLSFVHFIGRSLLASDIVPQEIFTPGYADLLKILPHTTSDNWQLFFDMNIFNPYAQELRERFWEAGLDLEEKIMRSEDVDSLAQNRNIIDLIDNRIMKLLKKRFEAVQKISEIKRERDMEIVDPKREEKILAEKVAKYDFDDEFIKDFYKLLFKESYKIQK